MRRCWSRAQKPFDRRATSQALSGARFLREKTVMADATCPVPGPGLREETHPQITNNNENNNDNNNTVPHRQMV